MHSTQEMDKAPLKVKILHIPGRNSLKGKMTMGMQVITGQFTMTRNVQEGFTEVTSGKSSINKM